MRFELDGRYTFASPKSVPNEEATIAQIGTWVPVGPLNAK